MTTPGGVFDPGLQPERTALAWRRAGLALGGGSLLLARVVAEASVPVALVVAVLGVAVAITILIAVERRYRSHHHRLVASAGERIRLAGGGLPFVVALTTVLLGSGAAVAVVLIALKVGR